MHWHAAYLWLESNGLWTAVVTWAVFTALTAAVAYLPWKRHRKAQAELLDRLDVHTPGGIRDIALLLKLQSNLLRKLLERDDE